MLTSLWFRLGRLSRSAHVPSVSSRRLGQNRHYQEVSQSLVSGTECGCLIGSSPFPFSNESCSNLQTVCWTSVASDLQQPSFLQSRCEGSVDPIRGFAEVISLDRVAYPWALWACPSALPLGLVCLWFFLLGLLGLVSLSFRHGSEVLELPSGAW